MQIELTHKRIAQALLVVGPLASLAVSPTSNYDPINLIKLLFICTVAFFCFGLNLSSPSSSISRLGKLFWISISLFVLSMISTLMFSGAPFTQQIWGAFGRNTGFLTYFSLLLLLINTALIQKVDFYQKLVNSLLITAIPMTIYCLIQYADLDPIGWSEKHPFGTLGNINFSSAFFGLTSICALVLLFEKKISTGLRLALGFLIVIDMFIVLSTGSIQGFMIFVAGSGLSGFLYIRSKARLRILRIPYTVIGLIGVSITVFGLSNKGPLAKFLFAPSIVFRTDYWHAGWQMTKEHLLFGVGLDSYGDWYRASRGMLSTLRTGPERIANTAHNIFLDISSNGGFPLITAYLAINLIAFRSALKVLKRDTVFRPYFVAIFSVWFGYLIFSAISINQVGVGIWGWLFTGALIGYEKSTGEISALNSQASRKKKSRKTSTLSPIAGLLGFSGLLIGFILSFIPFNADAKYKTAIQTGQLEKILQSTTMLGSSAFHSDMALDTTIKNNYLGQAREVTLRLNSKYPREFMGWKALWALDSSSPAEKTLAVRKLHELDPFNPDLPKS